MVPGHYLRGGSPSAYDRMLSTQFGAYAAKLIDKETYEAEYFSCHPCLCTSTIKLKTSDVKNMLLPKVHHEPIVVEL